MFIKYKRSIHNLNNYLSIVPTDKKTILLTKENGNYQVLEFVDTFTRDKVINSIWEELQKSTEFFDIDDFALMCKEVETYNIG